MPSKSSRTYAQIQEVGQFCVNVLAADQLDVCRLFTSSAEDKFGQVDWHRAPSGAPILHGAVSWMDCELIENLEGGDHWIAVGAIQHLAVQRRELPLLFFQGGYGRFHPASLVAPSSSELFGIVRLADTIRPDLEELAQAVHAEVALVAETGEWMTFVALANASDRSYGVTAGYRLPLVPPLGSVFLGDDPADIDAWLARLPRVDDDVRERLRAMGNRVREVGYSLSTLTGVEREIWEQAAELSRDVVTPARERDIRELLLRNMDSYECALSDDRTYDVRSIIVPVQPMPNGPKLALRLANPPLSASANVIRGWIDQVTRVAAAISSRTQSHTIS